jgi:hypothetical protein
MNSPISSRPPEEYSYVQAENAFTWEGGFFPYTREIGVPYADGRPKTGVPAFGAARSPAQRPEDWLLRQAVHFDGRRYRYNGYRYDRLADAIAHVALTRRCPSLLDPMEACSPETASAPPSVHDREAMAALGVFTVGPSYGWKTYRYDRLADAIAYAELMKARGE